MQKNGAAALRGCISAWWWFCAIAFARGAKCGAIVHILLGAHAKVDRLAGLMLRMKMLQKGHAPSTPCARAQALADQACYLRVLALQIAADFSQRDVKAKANIIVFVHDGTQR